MQNSNSRFSANSISNYDLFRWKVELLCHGIIIPSAKLILFDGQGISLMGGRKTGAGPAGGRYFLLPNESLVNVQIWIESHTINRFIFDTFDSNNQLIIKDMEKILPDVSLRLLSNPEYYQSVSKDNIPYQKIAVMHGDQTIASTINQRCYLWRNHEECKFCAIEFALDASATIERKTSTQLIDAITAARLENPRSASHMTLTTGNFPTELELIQNYSEILINLKKHFPEMPIHIQTEPFKDLEGLKVLKRAGADTIGIHLEILDDAIRKIVCPGKSRIPLKLYYENWHKAIEIFGKNQVSTFILTGFQEDMKIFNHILLEIIKLGVIPIITPARQIAGVKSIIPTSQGRQMVDILIQAAKWCLDFGVDPTRNGAGCVRCGGCSAIMDAFLLIKENPHLI